MRRDGTRREIVITAKRSTQKRERINTGTHVRYVQRLHPGRLAPFGVDDGDEADLASPEAAQ